VSSRAAAPLESRPLFARGSSYVLWMFAEGSSHALREKNEVFKVKKTFVEIGEDDMFEESQDEGSSGGSGFGRQSSDPVVSQSKTMFENPEPPRQAFQERDSSGGGQASRNAEPESEQEPQFAFIGSLPFVEAVWFTGYEGMVGMCMNGGNATSNQQVTPVMMPWICSPDNASTNVLHEQAWAFGFNSPSPQGEWSGNDQSNTVGRWADIVPDTSVPEEWSDVFTVMMRNLPNKYTQQMLRTELHQAGFEGMYDFLYLPIDPETSANKGYAFIDFINPNYVWKFKERFEGKQMARFNSHKFVAVSRAALQGFEANFRHYSLARCNRGDPSARPLFLMPGGEKGMMVPFDDETPPLPSEPPKPRLKVSIATVNTRSGEGSDQRPQQWPTLQESQKRLQQPGHQNQPEPSSSSQDEQDAASMLVCNCPKCGASVSASHRFCAFCGAVRLWSDEN